MKNIEKEQYKQLALNFLTETSPDERYGVRADLNKFKLTPHILELMVRFHQQMMKIEDKKFTEFNMVTFAGYYHGRRTIDHNADFLEVLEDYKANLYLK